MDPDTLDRFGQCMFPSEPNAKNAIGEPAYKSADGRFLLVETPGYGVTVTMRGVFIGLYGCRASAVAQCARVAARPVKRQQRGRAKLAGKIKQLVEED